tara:strand:+ start:31532 stop:31816 length:285 start_codon:yes stop_codon:yes gene_type:complete
MVIKRKLKAKRLAEVGLSMSDLKCNGYRRYGGAFTLGNPEWEKCRETPTVMIKVKNVKKAMPACPHCWQELLDSDDDAQEIESVEPIIDDAGDN